MTTKHCVPNAAQNRVEQLEQEIVDMACRAEDAEKAYERACETIAKMHAAAVGEVTGPRLGVVEDVAAVREANTTLLAALEGAIAELERVNNVKDGQPLVSHNLLADLRQILNQHKGT